jgi:glutamate carboxypeptidase
VQVLEGSVEEVREEIALTPESQKNLSSQLKILEELVKVPSETYEEKSYQNLYKIITRELKNLQFEVEELPNPDALIKSAPLLVGTLRGKSTEFVTLVAHVDTANFNNIKEPALTIEENKQWARGIGVLSNKGGVVIGLEALKLYLKSQAQGPELSLRFVVVPNALKGAQGFTRIFSDMARNSRAVLLLSPTLQGGDIVHARGGTRLYELNLKGRGVHSGLAHKQSANACHELAIKIEKLQKLTDYRREVTVTVPFIKGGSNVIHQTCEEATALLQLGFIGPKNKARIFKLTEEILKAQYSKAQSDGLRVTTQFKILFENDLYSSEKENKSYTELYRNLVEVGEGKKIQSQRVFSSGLSNFFYRQGLVLMDGLGPVGEGAYSSDERLVLSSLQSRAQALSRVISVLNY